MGQLGSVLIPSKLQFPSRSLGRFPWVPLGKYSISSLSFLFFDPLPSLPLERVVNLSSQGVDDPGRKVLVKVVVYSGYALSSEFSPLAPVGGLGVMRNDYLPLRLKS